MRKLTLTTFLLFTLITGLNAQIESVEYNAEKNWFSQGNDLPSETNWAVTGQIRPNILMVEVQLFATSDFDDKPIYVNDWERPFNYTGQKFTVQINEKLKSNSKYSFKINYYEELKNKGKLINLLKNNVSAYIDNSVNADKKNINLDKHPKRILDDLNQIIDGSLTYYRIINGVEFNGFSETVYDKLQKLDKLKLSKAVFNLKSDDEISDVDKKDNRRSYYLQNLKELKQLCNAEIEMLMAADFVIINKSRKIIDYNSEKLRNTFKINFGYAGVYESGNFSELNYDSNPYLGFSVPLGNQAFNSKFLSNSSLSAGVFLKDFKFNDGNTVTGPLIGMPLYLGYGYKAFKFVRFNVGVAVLQKDDVNSLNLSKIYLRPAFGVGVEVKLWMGLE